MKKLLVGIGIAVSLLTGVAFTNTNPASAAGGRDCDTNAIVRCGALDTAEMQTKYNQNTSGDLPAVFAHYGITGADISNTANMKMGRVYKDGRIEVDGNTVATGARSVGRENMTGSNPVTIAGKTYYERSTNVSFDSASIPAIVIMKNGVFHRAIITSCGNPVVATPKEQPKPVAPVVKAPPVTPVEKPKAQPENCPIAGKENLPKDSPDCKETPQVLPSTGPGALLSAGAGISSLTAAGYYFSLSRRKLLNSFLNR
ncbi:hypothetical protein CYG49_04290 [Candidatus Saccharibacteria bacterium]|nr:MAG: hypothetical protein CYG49_04290 [Candidatus Saccharibacteria bacterium]